MKDKINALRDDINAALEKVAKKHKLASLKCVGTVKYGSTNCEFKVEAVVAGGMNVDAERYVVNAAMLKLHPLGHTIDYKGRKYSSIGLNTTGTKVIVRQAVTNKEYLMPVALFEVRA